jgi:hypothetical protein
MGDFVGAFIRVNSPGTPTQGGGTVHVLPGRAALVIKLIFSLPGLIEKR